MSVTATSSLTAVRQEIGRTEQPKMKAALEAAVADNQLDEKDYGNLRAAFGEIHPGASDADFDSYLKTNLKLDPASIKAHDSKPVGVAFPDTTPQRDIALRVEGLTIEDKDGIETASKNDLSGKVSSIEGRLDLNGATRKTIADAADTATGGWGKWLGYSGNDVKSTYVPAKDGKPASQQLTLGSLNLGTLTTDNKGRLVLERGAVLDIADIASDKGIAGPIRDAIKQYTGLDCKVERDPTGKLVFVPQRMQLKGAQLAGDGSETAKALQGAQLEVKGRTSFEITPKGIGFKLEDGQITGSSNVAGPEAVARQGDKGQDAADRIEVAHADFTGAVTTDAQGNARLEGEVRDVKASARINKTLSSEDVKKIQGKIEQVRGKIDDFLKVYGLNRTAVEQIINKVGRDQIQTLLKSANPQAISSTAQQFGIDPKQLESTLSAIKEAPFQKMIDELNGLGTTLQAGARLDAEVRLNLDKAGIDTNRDSLLTSVSGLDLSARGVISGPDGTSTRFAAGANLGTASSDGDNTRIGPSSASLELDTTQANGSRVRVVGDVATPGETRLNQTNGVWSGGTAETRFSGVFEAFDPTSARTSFALANGNLGALDVSPNGAVNIAGSRLHVEGDVQETGPKDKKGKPGPVTSTGFSADVSTGAVSSQPVKPGQPASVTVKQVKANARLEAGPQGKKPVSSANIGITADKISANGSEIAADGTRIKGSIDGRQKIGFQTHAPGSDKGTGVRLSDQGISLDATAVDWNLAQKQGIDVTARGTTTLGVKQNKVVSSATSKVSGSMEAGTQQLLGIASQNPAFKGFIDGFMKNNGVQIANPRLKVSFSDGFVQGKNAGGQLRIDNIRTNYGTAKAAVRLEQKDGKTSYSGSLSLNPSQLVAQRMNAILAKETGMSTSTTLQDGQFQVTASSLLTSGAATIRLNGDHVDVAIDDAKLLNLFTVKGMARDKAMAALEKFKAQATSDHSLSIPLRELASQALGPEVASRLNLNATQNASGINLDFRYAP